MRIVAHAQYNLSLYSHTEQVELDLFGDENLGIRYEVDNIREANSKNSTYSKDYDIPATKKNNKFFNHIYDLTYDMKGTQYTSLKDFNPYKSCEVQVYEDGSLILDGVMFLNSINEKQNEYTYNVTIFSTSVGLLDALGESTIADLNFEDIEHDFTIANIQASNTTTGVTLSAGGTSTAVMYPLVDDGMIGYDTIATDVLDIDSRYNLPPCIQLKYVIDKLFDFAGYQFDSTFFNTTEFKNIYMDSGCNNQFSNVTEYGDVEVKPSGNLSISTSFADVIFNTELQDVNGLHNTSTGIYTAPEDNLSVTAVISLAIANTSGSNRTIYFRLVHNSTATSAPTSPIFAGQQTIPTGTTINVFQTAEVYLNSGETCNWEIRASGSNCTIDASFVVPGTSPPFTFISKYYFYTNNRTDGGYIFQHNRREVKLADLISDLTKMFNLIIEPDKDNPKKLNIEPFDDYVAGGVTHDWTRKIDRSEMTQTMFDLPRKLTFAMVEDDDDYYLKDYERTIGKEYGIQEVFIDVETDVEEEIRLDVFAPTALVKTHPSYASMSVITSSEDGINFERFDSAPRLMFKNFDTHNAGFAIFDQTDIYEGVFGAQVTEYSTSHHYEDSTGVLTTADSTLLFGNVGFLYHEVNALPLKTFYEKYWRNYIIERYVNLTHLLKVRIYLKPTDINRFSFKDKIRIDNQEYRVNSIDYTANSKKLATVELYKI